MISLNGQPPACIEPWTLGGVVFCTIKQLTIEFCVKTQKTSCEAQEASDRKDSKRMNGDSTFQTCMVPACPG